MYKKQLNSYRSCILINTNNISCLDNINISKEEKISALKLPEYKLNSIDIKSSDFSIYNNKNENKFINDSSKIKNIKLYNNKKELNSIDDLNDLKIESSLSKEEEINDENINNEIDYSEYIKENNNINNKQQNKINKNQKYSKLLYNNNENENSLEDINDININSLENTNNNNQHEIDIETYDINSKNDFSKKENVFKKNTNTKLIPNNKNINININTISEEDKSKIYKMLCQTLYNLCDNKGYIYFKYFLSLAEELVQEYNISSQLNEMTKEIKLLMQSSLLPGKFHIKSILKLLQNKKYDSMIKKIMKMKVIINTINLK